MNKLANTIQALLFTTDRPLSIKELSKATGRKSEEVREALHKLKDRHSDTGIVLLEQNDTYLFSTNPEDSEVVEEFLNSELREQLTDASLETLAIVTYKQPVSRSEIESIRGVNSQYTLRLLLMRGLIERTRSSADSRVHLYRTTHEFLQHMGLRSHEDLPDFEDLAKKVKPPEGFDNVGGSI